MKTRRLVVVADDFGIGPETDRGILEAARAGRLTATVLLVNTPYVEKALANWERAARPLAVGWHPNLTLDQPILPPEQVPSLVQPDGRFWPLGQFMKRLFTGRLRRSEIHAELSAQHQKFIDLLGQPPLMVNSHQHTSIFPGVSSILIEILSKQSGPRPYLRRVVEQARLIRRIPGARLKRGFLNVFGKRSARKASRAGLLGSDWLVGVTDPPFTKDPAFYTRWLAEVGGDSVEIGCHPGYIDETLLVRDVPGKPYDLERRISELQMLLRDDFTTAIRDAGFQMVSPREFIQQPLVEAA